MQHQLYSESIENRIILCDDTCNKTKLDVKCAITSSVDEDVALADDNRLVC